MYDFLEHPCLVVFPFLILIGLFSIQSVNNFVIVICDVAIVIFIMQSYVIMILKAWLLDLHKLWSALMIMLAK